MTEDDLIERLLRQYIVEQDDANNELPSPVRWPTQDPEPINEYTTEGYMAMAFPTLFPTGAADFRDQSRRQNKIGIADYLDALIRYVDGRFAVHPRYILEDGSHCSFLFWALNTKLRWQAQAQAKVFMKKTIGASDLTIADIRERLNGADGHTFVKSIQRFLEPVVGLTPYWQRQRRNLLAMVHQIGCGHLFFTLSAADTHWPDLHRLIEEVRAQQTGEPPLDISTLDPAAVHRRRVDNLINYPQICASFLHHRFKLFLNVVKTIPGLRYVDFWCRYEWQFRGSGHIHGIIWLSDGPALNEMDLTNNAHKQLLVDFFSKLIFGKAPIDGHPAPAINPCQVLTMFYVIGSCIRSHDPSRASTIVLT